MLEGYQQKNKVLIVHDHQVPYISEQIQNQLGKDWTVVGVKCFDEAMRYLENNEDIFALISDGEIPESLVENEIVSNEKKKKPRLKHGDYLTRWLSKRGELNNTPYLVIQWTTHNVSEGPSESHPIFKFIGSPSSFGRIILAWRDCYCLNTYNPQSLKFVLQDNVLNKYLIRGTNIWADIDGEQNTDKALAFIHDARHKALSCYLAIYNDFQSIEYWESQNNTSDVINNKKHDALKRIKRNAELVKDEIILGGINIELLDQYVNEKLRIDVLNSNKSVISITDNKYTNVKLTLGTAIDLEMSMRCLCTKLASYTSESFDDILKDGNDFSKKIERLQEYLRIIVTSYEDIMKYN